VQRARPADVLRQADGRWVVRGPNRRIHVLDSSGELVTTINHKTNAAVQHEIRTGYWNRLTIEQENLFRELFSNYVRW